MFPEVEVLDFAGPFEVFSVARTTAEEEAVPLFHVTTVGKSAGVVSARNGLQVITSYGLQAVPQADVLVLPGGDGRRKAMADPVILAWVKTQTAGAQLVLTVCTGAFILGEAGLLPSVATTHHGRFEEFEERYPGCALRKGTKFVDAGSVITSGGISAGIHASLYTVGRLHGAAAADATAAYMEYDFRFAAHSGEVL